MVNVKINSLIWISVMMQTIQRDQFSNKLVSVMPLVVKIFSVTSFPYYFLFLFSQRLLAHLIYLCFYAAHMVGFKEPVLIVLISEQNFSIYLHNSF